MGQGLSKHGLVLVSGMVWYRMESGAGGLGYIRWILSFFFFSFFLQQPNNSFGAKKENICEAFLLLIQIDDRRVHQRDLSLPKPTHHHTSPHQHSSGCVTQATLHPKIPHSIQSTTPQRSTAPHTPPHTPHNNLTNHVLKPLHPRILLPIRILPILLQQQQHQAKPPPQPHTQQSRAQRPIPSAPGEFFVRGAIHAPGETRIRVWETDRDEAE